MRINVVVQGPEKAGKGTLMAFLVHQLRAHGIEVAVQGAETHNREKLERPDDALIARLRECQVVLTEQQTH